VKGLLVLADDFFAHSLETAKRIETKDNERRLKPATTVDPVFSLLILADMEN
jgi:hypothetical protein